jgi:hypothetical protein
MFRLLLILGFAVALLALAPLRALADPKIGMSLPIEKRGGKVLVRAEDGLEELANRAEVIAEDALVEIADDLPRLPLPTTVEIRLVKQVVDLARASPPGAQPPDWAVGVAYPEVGVVVVGYRRDHEILDFEGTLRHELAHLALGAALRGRAPRWLDEGFAFLHAKEFHFDRSLALTGMAWSRDVYPLGELAQHFPPGKNAAARAYAQAYDFVAFLARRGRYSDKWDDGDRWAFRDYLAAIAGGKSAEQAAHEIYGTGLSELTDEWFQDLRDRYWLIPIGLVGVGGWVLGALLLIIAYLRRRARDRRILRRWEVEEAAEPEP